MTLSQWQREQIERRYGGRVGSAGDHHLILDADGDYCDVCHDAWPCASFISTTSTTAGRHLDRLPRRTEMAERRLVRITTDLLLPADFDFADLADVHVAAVVVEGAADTSLTNVIAYMVQEARVEVTDG